MREGDSGECSKEVEEKTEVGVKGQCRENGSRVRQGDRLGE